MQNNSKWYAIRAAEAQRPAEIFIFGDIGESWSDETVTARDFVTDIAAMNDAEIVVRINSFGGSVPDGLAIYNAIRRHPANITTSVEGVAMSIATLIAMAGDRRIIAENAMWMVHAPWTYAAGNAASFRQTADTLDKWAEAMSASYASQSGRPQDEMLALLTDGVDHYYTAAEAVEAGFLHELVVADPAANARGVLASAATRFKSLPAAWQQAATPAAAAAITLEQTMPDPIQNQAAAQPTAEQTAAISAAAIKADSDRRTAINALAAGRFATDADVVKLMSACANDVQCSVDTAREKLLAHIGKDSKPVGGVVVTEQDERDKMRAATTGAILARAGIRGDHDKDLRANPMRGMKMLDIARACVESTGRSTRGMNQMEIVAAAFTTSASDFPVLLENVMHKVLQTAYTAQADTWTRFCARGTVSDFRPHHRYRTGYIGNLDDLSELAEYKNKSIPDGEKASITVGTKGNIINVSRQMIINDDLTAFVTLAQDLGRAGKRTIEAMVYALLAQNSGAGPTMPDGLALFHATHGNLAGSGGAPTVTTVDVGRQAMASQRDVSGNEFLDLRPAVALSGLSQGGTLRTINAAEFDTEVSNKFQVPNRVRGLFRDVVDTPRISGNSWMLFADPSEAPVIEVAFLDGIDEPYLEMQNGFDVDGVRWKVRLDVGVGAVDFKGAYRNVGA